MSSGTKTFFNVADLPSPHPRSNPSQPPHSFSPALRLIVPLARFLVYGSHIGKRRLPILL